MPFIKGHSGNPTGRPQGATNKVNQEIRERINQFLDENFESVKSDLMNIEPKERVKFYIELLSFGLPRLKAIEVGMTVENVFLPINLSRNEVKQISEYLENSY